MSEEELIKLWNMGLTKLSVAKKYMNEYNKRIRDNKEMKKINVRQALEYVEPILFRYRMNQLREKRGGK